MGRRTGADERNEDARSAQDDDTDLDEGGLKLSVPDDVRRAVKLSRAMECLGKHWRTNLTRPEEWVDLSEPCDTLDDFISHDWRTSGVLKYLSLCLLYNTRAAFFSCMIVSIIVGILATPGALHALPADIRFEHTMFGKPYIAYFGCWALILGPLTFILFFLFWQPPGIPRLVFMDKLCIDQVNDDKKHRAIMSLAGFLRLSKSFVLLWSPQYLTRLWCVYEVATWLHLAREFDQMRSVPVGLVAILLNFFLSLWLLLLVYSGGRYVHPGVRLMLMGIAMVFLSAVSYFLNLRLVHPLTGDSMPCDRQLIYAAIESWIKIKVEAGRSSGIAEITQENSLDAFNELVHTVFGPAVVWKAGGTLVDYKFFICFAVVPEICLICDRIPLMAITLQTDLMDGSRYILYQVVMFSCCMPLGFKGQMLFVKCLARYSNSWRDVIAHSFTLVAWAFCCLALVVVIEVSLAIKSPVVQLLLSPVLAIATVVVFYEPWDQGRGIRSSSFRRRDCSTEQVIVDRLRSTSSSLDDNPKSSESGTASDEDAADGRSVVAI